MNRTRKILLVLLFAIVCFGVFEFGQQGKVAGCDPNRWEVAKSFDADLWSRGIDREKFYPLLKKMLLGKTKKDVTNMLGSPIYIQKTVPPAFEYSLGRLKLFSCTMNLEAIMLVKFDGAERVNEVTTFAD